MIGPDASESSLWYVPTAALGEGLGTSFTDRQAAMLQRDFGFGVVKTIDVATVQGPALAAELRDLRGLSAVFLESGNTYYLRHHLRASGADGHILRLLAAGGVAVGSSAGTIVLGRTVQTAFWKDWDDRTAGGSISVDWSDPRLSAGLDVCGGRSFLPHANGRYADRRWQDDQQRRHGHMHEVVRLADGQGFVVDGPSTRLVGRGL